MYLCAHFNYNLEYIDIQCKLEDKIGDVIKRYSDKIQINPESLFFLYNGNIVDDKNQKLKNIINKQDLERGEFHVLVYPNDNDSEEDKNQVEVEINYKNDITKIIPEPNEKMENTVKKFLSIKKVDENTIYFCFMGKPVL